MPAKDLVFTVLGIDRASGTFDKVGDSMDRLGRRATRVLSGVATGSAATAAAAVGAAGALGGLSAGFIGLGAVALRENEKVRQSVAALGETINRDLAKDAGVLADEFVGAADTIGAGFQRLRPQLRDAFEAVQPHVDTLTRGLVDAAENAMPGLVAAVEDAGPVMEGFADLTRDVGTATGDFFRILGENSESAGEGLAHFGDLAKTTLPELAEIVGSLTDAWAEHGDEVSAIVGSLTGSLGALVDLLAPALEPTLELAAAGDALAVKLTLAALAVGKLAGALSSEGLGFAGAVASDSRKAADAAEKGGKKSGNAFVSGAKGVLSKAGWAALGFSIADELTDGFISRNVGRAIRESLEQGFSVGEGALPAAKWLGGLELEIVKFMGTNEQAAQDIRDSWRNKGEEIRESYQGLMNTLTDDARQGGRDQADAARDSADSQLGSLGVVGAGVDRNRAKTQNYSGTLRRVPKNVRTHVTTPGLGGASARMSTYLHRVNAIPRNVSTTVTTIFTSVGTGPTAANRLLSSAGADGGLVTPEGIRRFDSGGMVRGPGGPRSDIIPALLSNGEFVVNADSTRRFRSILEAINRPGHSAAAVSAFSTAPQQPQRVVVELDLRTDDEDLLRRLRRTIRVRGGGNVQAVLGNGRR